MFRFIWAMDPTFPLGMGYIAAVLEKRGHHVRIYDAEWNEAPFSKSTRIAAPSVYMANNWMKYARGVSDRNNVVWTEIGNVLKAYRPEVVGITTCSLNLKSAANVARIAKSIDRGVMCVLGGPGATIMPEDVIADENVDFVVRGEGEETMAELLVELGASSPDFGRVDGLVHKRSDRVIRNKDRELVQRLDDLPYPAKHLFMDLEKAQLIGF